VMLLAHSMGRTLVILSLAKCILAAHFFVSYTPTLQCLSPDIGNSSKAENCPWHGESANLFQSAHFYNSVILSSVYLAGFALVMHQMDGTGSNQVAFSDFFDIEGIGAKQKGLNIVTMEQFLEREGLQGNLRSYFGGESEVVYPPNNRIKWDNQPLDQLWNYIRNVTTTFQWNPTECVSRFALDLFSLLIYDFM
jgi:hypothetical protein